MSDSKTRQSNVSKEKGNVYTPDYLVNDILDIAGYSVDNSNEVIDMQVLEPSCGDGAFLTVMIDRLIASCRVQGISENDISARIYRNIHAIELSVDEADKARNACVETAANEGVLIVRESLDIVCTDAISYMSEQVAENKTYDAIIGNPPYVRIHNMPSSLREIPYCSSGMTDMFLAFYYLCEQLLDDDGSLTFITPSSWTTSKSGRDMRESLKKSGKLKIYIDLAFKQPFIGFSTYTSITRIINTVANDCLIFGKWSDIENAKSNGIDKNTIQETFANIKLPPVLPAHVYDISTKLQKDNWIGHESLLIPECNAETRKIIEFDDTHETDGIYVRNGFATNLDGFFINDDMSSVKCGPYNIEVVKSSTGKRSRAFFPYDLSECDGTGTIPDIVSFTEFNGYDISDDLVKNKRELMQRNGIDPIKWWGYGRSQGISDTGIYKVAINSLYRGSKDIKINAAPAGIGVYGGVYVVGMNIEDINNALKHPLYMQYARAIGQKKSGGYYSLTGKQIQRYIRYWKKHLNSM